MRLRVTDWACEAGRVTGRRVFLDVGGHMGETLAEVIKPRWRFDRIWSFEPVAGCVVVLESLADARVTVVPAGWWSANTEMVLNNPGALNASIEPIDGATTSERCRFIDGATWMAENIAESDQVWMKMNIEASEIEVLDRLLSTGEISKVDHLVVHFDVEWHGRYADAAVMRRRLDDAGVSWSEAKRVMFGRTRGAKTATWLATTQGERARPWLAMLEHQARRRVWRVRRWVRHRRAARDKPTT